MSEIKFRVEKKAHWGRDFYGVITFQRKRNFAESRNSCRRLSPGFTVIHFFFPVSLFFLSSFNKKKSTIIICRSWNKSIYLSFCLSTAFFFIYQVGERAENWTLWNIWNLWNAVNCHWWFKATLFTEFFIFEIIYPDFPIVMWNTCSRKTILKICTTCTGGNSVHRPLDLS